MNVSKQPKPANAAAIEEAEQRALTERLGEQVGAALDLAKSIEGDLGHVLTCKLRNTLNLIGRRRIQQTGVRPTCKRAVPMVGRPAVEAR